ncbi:MAG: hypothetical protein LBS18_02015 [Clostridiales bacterium]|jgi:AcrR family transcriptional regulator|nr:hypothetical protein [Clostridiales bacterium]
MDERITKTNKSIKDAFLHLREQFPLHKIKVRELCRIAQINKTTFYRRYDDIYALAEEVEEDMINKFVSDLNKGKSLYEDPGDFFLALDKTMNSANEKVKCILFSDKVETMWDKLEVSLKEQYLAGKSSLKEYVALTFAIGGVSNVCLGFYRDGTEINVYEIYAMLAELVNKSLNANT